MVSNGVACGSHVVSCEVPCSLQWSSRWFRVQFPVVSSSGGPCGFEWISLWFPVEFPIALSATRRIG
jgi:hypothetical protein